MMSSIITVRRLFDASDGVFPPDVEGWSKPGDVVRARAACQSLVLGLGSMNIAAISAMTEAGVARLIARRCPMMRGDDHVTRSLIAACRGGTRFMRARANA